MHRPLNSAEAAVLAELDRRFAEHLVADRERMEADGVPGRVARAVIEENRRLFAERRIEAAIAAAGATAPVH